MNLRALVVLCGLCCGTAGASQAQQQWVGVSGDEQVFYSVELSSVKPRDPYLRAWVHVEWSHVQSDGFIGYGMLNLINCADEEWAFIQLVGYREPMFGRPVAPETIEEEFSMPPPGSSGGRVIEFVCAYAKGEKWALEAQTSPMPVSPDSLP